MNVYSVVNVRRRINPLNILKQKKFEKLPLFFKNIFFKKQTSSPSLPYISSYLNGVTFRKKWNRRSLLSVVVLGYVVSFAIVCGRLKLNHSR